MLKNHQLRLLLFMDSKVSHWLWIGTGNNTALWTQPVTPPRFLFSVSVHLVHTLIWLVLFQTFKAGFLVGMFASANLDLQSLILWTQELFPVRNIWQRYWWIGSDYLVVLLTTVVGSWLLLIMHVFKCWVNWGSVARLLSLPVKLPRGKSLPHNQTLQQHVYRLLLIFMRSCELDCMFPQTLGHFSGSLTMHHFCMYLATQKRANYMLRYQF